MAVQTEMRDTYLLTAEMFAREVSGLSAHGTHSAYIRTPVGATDVTNSLNDSIIKIDQRKHGNGLIIIVVA